MIFRYLRLILIMVLTGTRRGILMFRRNKNKCATGTLSRTNSGSGVYSFNWSESMYMPGSCIVCDWVMFGCE